MPICTVIGWTSECEHPIKLLLPCIMGSVVLTPPCRLSAAGVHVSVHSPRTHSALVCFRWAHAYVQNKEPVYNLANASLLLNQPLLTYMHLRCPRIFWECKQRPVSAPLLLVRNRRTTFYQYEKGNTCLVLICKLDVAAQATVLTGLIGKRQVKKHRAAVLKCHSGVIAGTSLRLWVSSPHMWTDKLLYRTFKFATLFLDSWKDSSWPAGKQALTRCGLPVISKVGDAQMCNCNLTWGQSKHSACKCKCK